MRLVLDPRPQSVDLRKVEQEKAEKEEAKAQKKEEAKLAKAAKKEEARLAKEAKKAAKAEENEENGQDDEITIAE